LKTFQKPLESLLGASWDLGVGLGALAPQIYTFLGFLKTFQKHLESLLGASGDLGGGQEALGLQTYTFLGFLKTFQKPLESLLGASGELGGGQEALGLLVNPSHCPFQMYPPAPHVNPSHSSIHRTPIPYGFSCGLLKDYLVDFLC